MEGDNKTISDFNWDRSEESEKQILKKVADAFDIPIQRWEKLENSEKRSFVHLSKSEEKFFHIVLNYTQSKLIVGEFAVCNQTGIPKEIYNSWRNIILKSFSKMSICDIDTLKVWLKELSYNIPHIGEKTINNTARLLYRAYADGE